MLRKVLVIAALTFGAQLATSSEASAAFCCQTCYTPCYSSCYTWCCMDEYIVYRWDYCWCRWVVDSVYPAYCGNLALAEWQASWRVWQLHCCGIPAYYQGFVARYDVYRYNCWRCRWELYYPNTTAEYAAYLVCYLQCQGYCAYSCCHLVPIYAQPQAQPSGQQPQATQQGAPAPQPAPPAPKK